jgi:hypothetical protein
MLRFIVLSLLLHVWVVLLFGDTGNVASERAGSAKFGSFFARLNPLASPRTSSPATSAKVTATKSGASGRATTAPPPNAVSSADASAAIPPASVPQVETQPAAVPEPIPTLPILAVEAPAAPTTFVVPLLPPPTPGEVVAPFSIQPLAAPILAAPIALPKDTEPLLIPMLAPVTPSTPVLPTREVILQEPKLRIEPITLPPSPTMMVAPIPTLPPPEIAREITPPAQLKIRAEPLTLPPPTPILEPVIAPAPNIAPQSTVKPIEVAPQVFAPPPAPVPTPVPAPPAPQIQTLPPIPQIATPAIAAPTSTVKPIDVSPQVFSPAQVPTVTAPTITRELGNTLNRDANAAPTAVTPAIPSNTNTPATTANPAASTPPGRAELPTISGVPLSGGANAPLPKLDLDSLRSRARQLASDGTGPRTLLPFPTAPPDPTKRNIEKIFDKALKRPDCKDAYADMGLAAVLPLVRDALKDGGCKW